jgi:hypothetical protein
MITRFKYWVVPAAPMSEVLIHVSTLHISVVESLHVALRYATAVTVVTPRDPTIHSPQTMVS